MRPIRTLGCVFAIAALVAVGARADENDRLTYMTFSGPVQLPGVTLAAGTYTFKLADLSGSKHVVHVMTKEDSPKLITTLMTIPNERLEPVKDTYIMFQERPAGMPQAMKAWFYPGRSIGEEFIYPKQQAIEIAQANNTAVLSSEGDDGWSRQLERQFRAGLGVDCAARRRRRATTADSESTTTTAAAATTTAAPERDHGSGCPGRGGTGRRSAGPSRSPGPGCSGRGRDASSCAAGSAGTEAGRHRRPGRAEPAADGEPARAVRADQRVVDRRRRGPSTAA